MDTIPVHTSKSIELPDNISQYLRAKLTSKQYNIIEVTENMNLDMFQVYQHGDCLIRQDNYLIIEYDRKLWLFYWGE